MWALPVANVAAAIPLTTISATQSKRRCFRVPISRLLIFSRISSKLPNLSRRPRSELSSGGIPRTSSYRAIAGYRWVIVLSTYLTYSLQRPRRRDVRPLPHATRQSVIPPIPAFMQIAHTATLPSIAARSVCAISCAKWIRCLGSAPDNSALAASASEGRAASNLSRRCLRSSTVLENSSKLDMAIVSLRR